MSPPDPEDEKQDPVSRGATEMDPTERQFWDLDDDEDLPEDAKDVRPAPPPAEPETEGAEEDPFEDESDESGGDPGDDLEPSEGPPSLRNTSQIEKISMIAFGGLLAALGLWITIAFIRELPTDDPNAPADLPVKGTKVTIKDIETYWRDPVEGRDRGIRAGVKVVPAAELTLKKRDGKGALRIFFEDDGGNLTGDPITLAFSNGTFAANGKNLIEAYCTEGFSNLGDFPAYVTGQTESWFLIVKEGPSSQARGTEFKEIVRTPVLPQKR